MSDRDNFIDPPPKYDGYAYLATAYSHPNYVVRQTRYKVAVDVCARLVVGGFHILSPIVHWHPVAVVKSLPTDAEFWWDLNEAYLKGADFLFVLDDLNWQTSVGVSKESAWALDHNLTSYLLTFSANGATFQKLD